MSTFCRHNRFAETCPICSRASRTRPGTVAGREAASRSTSGARDGGGAGTSERSPSHGQQPRSVAARRRRAARSGDVVVRRVARAVEDGYASELVPGLRASADATRLATEIGFAVARLEELELEPPGPLAEIATLAPEEALWRLFVVALLSPLEQVDDPYAAITAAFVPWETGELPAIAGPESFGPRGGDPRRLAAVVAAYRGRAERAGSQHALLLGDPGWPATRRFDRAFERLATSGFGRAPRYELLLLCARLGLLDTEPWTLALGEATDPTVLAAKRVFGIGDAVNLGRRSSELAAACDVPVSALDLALVNWAAPPTAQRIVAGATVHADDDVVARVSGALAV